MSAIRQVAIYACAEGDNTANFPAPTIPGNLIIAAITKSGGIFAVPTGFTNLAGISTSATSGDSGRMSYRIADGGSSYNVGGTPGVAATGVMWEVSDAAIAGSTLLALSQQATALPASLGSLGSVGAGQVCLMFLAYELSSITQETPGSGWTKQLGAFHVNCSNGHPRHYSAYATGPHAALAAQASLNGNGFSSKEWGGVAIKLVNTAPTGRVFVPGFIG